MALEMRLSQKLSQQLLMTPQLQQAIKLLQLGRLEYIEALEKELLENPILEKSSDEESDSKSEQNLESSPLEEPMILNGENSLEPGATAKSDQSPVEWNDYLDSFSSDSRGAAAPKSEGEWEDRPSIENTAARQETLSEHLFAQLRMMSLPQRQLQIAQHIVCNLNKDGYLCCTIPELIEEAQCSEKEATELLSIIQQLDPIGAASRDLKECLLIQLEAMGMGESLAARIVNSHLDTLANRGYSKIAKVENVLVEEVYKAVKEIQSLEPRPGRPFGADSPRYIVPDIYVYKQGEEYVITLNEEGIPKLRISPHYLTLLKEQVQAAPQGGDANTYLNDRLKAATWLIKSIHQRQRTIYKVTESIVKRQREFFDRGIEHLKPMVLKDIADDIGVHESTVSRVTNSKYVHTPHGVFELKFFFTSAIQGGTGEVSSSSVKEKIKTLITAESPGNPISDQEIVEKLSSDGIKIARRTVAKYREALNIPSSSKRKKAF